MKTLNDVSVRLDMMNDLIYEVEGAMLRVDGMSAEQKRFQTMFYLLMEQVDKLTEEFNEAFGHIEVCNAIYAANRVNELKSELEELKRRVQ